MLGIYNSQICETNFLPGWGESFVYRWIFASIYEQTEVLRPVSIIGMLWSWEETEKQEV